MGGHFGTVYRDVDLDLEPGVDQDYGPYPFVKRAGWPASGAMCV